MVIQPLAETITLLRRPVLWIPGLYAGLLTAVVIWLEFSGFAFISEKILFLGAVLTPFFIGGALGCMNLGDFTLAAFFRSGARNYFAVLLPLIIAITISILLLVLFSIPFMIAGLGNDATLIGGLFIGIIVPVTIFAFFADNAAVAGGLATLASLKQSMLVASRAFMTVILCFIISAFTALALMIFVSMIWGMILADKFASYLELNMTEQMRVFNGYGLSDWQQTLGPDGIAVTTFLIALYIAVLFTPFIVFKHQCYLSAESVEAPAVMQTGEYDEKGRWYKY